MELEVVERININDKVCEKIGEFLYHRPTDTLFADCAWWFPVQMSISDGLTKCQVTPMFLKMPFLMKKWINLDILLRLIDLLKLTLTGKILMHASCVDDTLIVGLPNAGKTYETYRRFAEGGKLISEEYTIIDGKTASPYRRVMRTCFSKSSLKIGKLDTSLYEKIWLAAATLRAKLFPFMYEAVIWKMIPASGKTSEIKRIVYGSTGQEIKDWKIFAILCENEFPFMSSEFLQAYALASGLDLLGIQNKQRELIRRFVLHVYPNKS